MDGNITTTNFENELKDRISFILNDGIDPGDREYVLVDTVLNNEERLSEQNSNRKVTIMYINKEIEQGNDGLKSFNARKAVRYVLNFWVLVTSPYRESSADDPEGLRMVRDMCDKISVNQLGYRSQLSHRPWLMISESEQTTDEDQNAVYLQIWQCGQIVEGLSTN